MDTIQFIKIEGRAVPVKPWPQVFYISKNHIAGWDGVEVRPLTVTGLFKGLTKNFITMNYWRLMCSLRWLGFLTTRECEPLSWRHFTFKFWKSYRYKDFRK